MKFVSRMIICCILIVTTAGSFTNDNLSLQFDVFKGTKLVGNMNCIRLEKNGFTEYTNETRMTVSVLTDVSVHNKVQAVYSKGMLQHGSFYRKINSGLKANDRFEWVKDRYIINASGKQTEFKSVIHHSVCQLMFTEPSALEQSFSENLKAFVKLKKLSANKYALLMPDGNNNIYSYKNGKCIEVELETSFGAIYIRPRK